ncbi:hypothetical protein GQ600_4165 [Phytophthora cactorum]|nr:hypothetical protein GQ600_4165 [Phytophthora cactorum]
MRAGADQADGAVKQRLYSRVGQFLMGSLDMRHWWCGYSPLMVFMMPCWSSIRRPIASASFTRGWSSSSAPVVNGRIHSDRYYYAVRDTYTFIDGQCGYLPRVHAERPRGAGVRVHTRVHQGVLRQTARSGCRSNPAPADR